MEKTLITYEGAGGDVLAVPEVREGSGEPSRGRFEVWRSTGGEVVIIDEVVVGLDSGRRERAIRTSVIAADN